MPKRKSQEGPNPLDIAMGARIRLRRREIGVSQKGLAHAVGITFQQVQKYEHGVNRVSFSRLIEICIALQCSLADLISDLDADKNKRVVARQSANLAELGANDLLAVYAKIRSPKQRRALLDLARQLAGIE